MQLGKKIGTMPCPEHPGQVLLVRENEKTGTLSARCDECDDSHYAKKGTGKFAAWLKKLTRTPAEAKPAAAETKGEKKAGGVLDSIV